MLSLPLLATQQKRYSHQKSVIMNNSRQIQLLLPHSKLQSQEQILLSTYIHS